MRKHGNSESGMRCVGGGGATWGRWSTVRSFCSRSARSRSCWRCCSTKGCGVVGDCCACASNGALAMVIAHRWRFKSNSLIYFYWSAPIGYLTDPCGTRSSTSEFNGWILCVTKLRQGVDSISHVGELRKYCCSRTCILRSPQQSIHDHRVDRSLLRLPPSLRSCLFCSTQISSKQEAILTGPAVC